MTLWVSKQLIEIKQYFKSQKDPILQIVTPNADLLKNKLTIYSKTKFKIAYKKTPSIPLTKSSLVMPAHNIIKR